MYSYSQRGKDSGSGGDMHNITNVDLLKFYISAVVSAHRTGYQVDFFPSRLHFFVCFFAEDRKANSIDFPNFTFVFSRPKLIVRFVGGKWKRYVWSRTIMEIKMFAFIQLMLSFFFLLNASWNECVICPHITKPCGPKNFVQQKMLINSLAGKRRKSFRTFFRLSWQIFVDIMNFIKIVRASIRKYFSRTKSC